MMKVFMLILISFGFLALISKGYSQVTFSPETGLLNTNQTITCVAIDRHFPTVSFTGSHGRSPWFSIYNSNTPFWNKNVPEVLKQRGHLSAHKHGLVKYAFGVTLSPLLCSDAGVYSCFDAPTRGTSGFLNSPLKVGEDTLIIKALPDTPTLHLMKRGMTRILTCTGDVGNPPQAFVWYRFRQSEQDFLPYIQAGEIQNDQPLEHKTRCQFTGRSVLTYRIGNGDRGLQFRCQIKSNLSGVDSIFFADFQVPTIDNKVETTKGLPTLNTVANSIGFPCVDDFFGMYKVDEKPVLYCRGLTDRSSSIVLSRYTRGSHITLLRVEHGRIASSSASLSPRVTVNTSSGHRTEVLVHYNSVQCEDNAMYRCEVHQTFDGRSQQTSERQLTLYQPILRAKITTDHQMTLRNAGGHDYAVSIGKIIKMTCAAHVPSLPATIEWYRISKKPMNRILWDKGEYLPESNQGTSCEYELTNQVPYFVEDSDRHGIDFVCIIRSNGTDSSDIVSVIIQ